MRCLYSVFEYYSQVEKGNLQLGFYTKYKLYASVKFNLILWFATAVVTIIIAVPIQYSSPNAVPFVSSPTCVNKQLPLLVLQLVFVAVAMILLIIKCWNVEEAYYIKTELKLVFLGSVPISILWVIAKLTHIFPAGFQTSTLVMGAVIGSSLGGVAFPLLANMYVRRPPWFLRNRRRRSSTSSQNISEIDRMKELAVDDTLFNILKVKCQRSWCVENALFFRAACEFHNGSAKHSPEEQQKLAWEVYNTHIKPGTPLEVNLDMPVRETIRSRLESGDSAPDLFDEALKEVFSMLQFGVYRELARTPEFLRMFPADYVSAARVQPEAPREHLVHTEMEERL